MRRLLLLALLAAPLAAAQGPANEIDDAEVIRRREETEQERAAEYRLARSAHTMTAEEDARVAAYAEQTLRILADGSSPELEPAYVRLWRWTRTARARGLAEDGLDEHPYARRAGDLLMARLKAEAQAGSAEGMRLVLSRIWLWLPDYDRTAEAFTIALEGAEGLQNFRASVRLDATQPRDLVAFDGTGMAARVGALCAFLVRHGDRETVAPRAQLGLARAWLLAGGRDDLVEARRAYDEFLARFPEHPLVFEVLCEQALSWLATYRGDTYDAGALTAAALIIDQAEIEARGDRELLARASAYRARIRGWQQDRDLAIARWYRSRGEPAWLSPLRHPSGLRSWLDGARYYYRETVLRDPGSAQARTAQQELADLPADGPLGEPLPEPPK
ncbi:MAG: hypothetical protein RLZZ127_2772 [Planctomycetota bacterium]|jgi:hypothetical protein